MIAHFPAARGGKIVYPQDSDGCQVEAAIVVTLDADDQLIITQENRCVCIPSFLADELIKAIKEMAKEAT